MSNIEIYRDFDVFPQAQVFLLGHDVFAVPAAELVAMLQRETTVDVDDDFTCTVNSLSIGLCRSITVDDDSDEEEVARYTSFGSILIAPPGYYDPPPPPAR